MATAYAIAVRSGSSLWSCAGAINVRRWPLGDTVHVAADEQPGFAPDPDALQGVVAGARARWRHARLDRQGVRLQLGIWKRLTVFVEDSRVPLDNNATERERAIRAPVVGRQNHYGSKSRRGTEVASTLYSILETAKLQRIAPATYVAAAIAAARHSETLMPWQFSASWR